VSGVLLDPRGRHALAIDTTSDSLSLALLRDGRLVASHYALTGTRMARTVFARIDDLLAGAKLAPQDLHWVAAARGPGSFTGTRIGLGIAMTLSQVTGAPLIGVDALRVLAEQTGPAEGGPFHTLLNCAPPRTSAAPMGNWNRRGRWRWRTRRPCCGWWVRGQWFCAASSRSPPT
jgi:tRNA threonylcarbamoyl adenosine modification protein YeaZ